MIAIFMRILNECMTNNFLKLSVSLYSSKLGPITDTMVMCVVYMYSTPPTTCTCTCTKGRSVN